MSGAEHPAVAARLPDRGWLDYVGGFVREWAALTGERMGAMPKTRAAFLDALSEPGQDPRHRALIEGAPPFRLAIEPGAVGCEVEGETVATWLLPSADETADETAGAWDARRGGYDGGC